MYILRICGIGVAGAVMGMLMKRLRPEIGAAASLAAGLLLAVLSLPMLQEVISSITAIARAGGLADGYLGSLLKVCGISLLTDFAAQTCRDAGESGLAMKVELAGRVTLIGLSLPFMQALLTQILSLAG